ncbi:MAG: HlyC/CorC family transporter [Candidatus Auribacter fodinae]|jgi:CBS domain containing-hemolysin-like protein|uniref:HlyC/CorC family transporter n=1 Tax=Candidatus Auribacter fodinae TaxID=2093366 RepID=A0A3A4R5T5_9BACT|nr:MAG: HlyC/CorC family transporter [Candidatus Auribacter fodinae]
MIFIFLTVSLIVFSLCSSLEVTLWLISDIKAKLLEDKSPRIKKVVSLWVHHSENIISTLLIIKSLAGICLVALVLSAEMQLLPHYDSMSVLILSCMGISLVFITICEVVPKILIKRKPDLIPIYIIRPFYYISFIFFVVNALLRALANSFTGILRVPAEQTDYSFTEEEIKTIIEMGEEEGTVEADERKMIHSIFDFGETIVREVMSPRVDMICIQHTAALKQAVELIRDCHHSRIPVYKENIDNIVGILYAKDILDFLEQDVFHKTAVRDIMHPPMFVPETKLISELLHEFRKDKTHLAIAVDEYGGTSGVVTIEDILEEIIGEIQDEYDTDEEALFTQHSDHYIFDAKMPIPEFKELLNIDDEFEDESEYDSLGGYAFYQLGRIPQIGEIFVRHNLEFEVVDADEKRVITLKVSIIKSEYKNDTPEHDTNNKEI